MQIFFLIFPINLKVFIYVKKLSRKFKQDEKNKENKEQIDGIKKGIDNIQLSFTKEIRREKLKEIEK
jgi:hypothetical protein